MELRPRMSIGGLDGQREKRRLGWDLIDKSGSRGELGVRVDCHALSCSKCLAVIR